MYYNIINSRKFRLKKLIFIYLLIIAHVTTFNSCMTTENISVTPGSLDSASVHEISKIRLKDGTSIDCEGKIIKLIKDKDSALVLDISAYTVGSNFNTYWTYKQINASDILKIQLEKSVANTSATITLIVIGAVFLTACILIGNAMKDFHFNKPY